VTHTARASRVASRYLWAARLDALKPNDKLTVYHGTRLAEVFGLINGFDANKVKYRHYGGPRHPGLFVAPDEKTAEKFASYGEIILELVVQAKNLHGVDYSGNIGRSQDMAQSTREWLEEKFPKSFRPYLSLTMTQANEPQALLRGLVAPNQIKRVRYKPYGEDAKWYSRKQFLDLDLEATPAAQEPYGSKRKLRDIGYDMSYPGYSLDQFLDATAAALGYDKDQIEETFKRMVGLGEGHRERIEDLIENTGFGPTATKEFLKKMEKAWA